MSNPPTVHLEVEDATARVIIDNPGKRNAMTRAMWSRLGEVVSDAASMPSVRVLVVAGAGDHFCAGADIAEFADGRDEDYDRINARAEEALAGFPGPTVAMIRGNCVGGGVSIAVACDVRIAAEDAVFGVTPARLGLVYPAESLRRLVSIVGPAVAKRLLFTADIIGAAQASSSGLVDHVLPSADLAGHVDEVVETLLSRSSLTQQAMKELIDEIVRTGSAAPATATRWDRLSTMSGEVAEGVAAFSERRPARFPWRRGAADGTGQTG